MNPDESKSCLKLNFTLAPSLPGQDDANLGRREGCRRCQGQQRKHGRSRHVTMSWSEILVGFCLWSTIWVHWKRGFGFRNSLGGDLSGGRLYSETPHFSSIALQIYLANATGTPIPADF